VELESAPVAQVPLVATGPLQPPEAVQEVASNDFQLKAEVPPPATVTGSAVNVTSGMGELTTTPVDGVEVAAGFEALGSEPAVCPEDDDC
jgi:hypothetical protein